MLDIVDAVTGPVETVLQVSVQDRPSLAEHKGVDRNDDISSSRQSGAGRIAVIDSLMVLLHCRMVVSQVRHFLLSENEHPAV